MRIYLFLLIFCLPSSLHGQNSYEKYQEYFFSFTEQKDFLNVAKTSYKWANLLKMKFYNILFEYRQERTYRFEEQSITI